MDHEFTGIGTLGGKISSLSFFLPCLGNSFLFRYQSVLLLLCFVFEYPLLLCNIFISRAVFYKIEQAKIVSSWIVCHIASLMLSNFVWGKSPIKLCFSCFTANNSRDFQKTTFARGGKMT